MLPKNIQLDVDTENEYSNDELDQIINSLALYDTQIRIDEIFSLENYDYINRFIEKIKNDKRFIVIFENDETHLFILPQSAFVEFLCRLNIKLGSLKIGRLDRRELEKYFINSILKTDNKEILGKLIKKAEKLSLLEIDGGCLLFPLANIFSVFFRILNNDFYELIKKIIEEENKKRKIRKTDIIKIFSVGNHGDKKSIYDKRNLEIILYRLGLKKSKRFTLEEIGSRYRLTRERVRQIIDKELNILKQNFKIKRALAEMILRYIIINKGRKIYFKDRDKDNIIINLLAYFVDIYICDIDKLKLFYISFDNKEIKLINKLINLENIGRNLFESSYEIDPKNRLFLSKKDKSIIREEVLKKISRYKIEKELIIKAMERIGRPAHYVDIASECNKIGSDIKVTPNDVLRNLTRKSGETEEWTWAGRRGYYALKKWGYKRPKENLFTTVSKIVNKYYREFKRPIHINLIKSEIQKTGRLFSEGSIYFACHENPEIEEIRKNWFVPRKNEKEKVKHEENYIDLDYLDKAIRDLDKFRGDG